MCELRIVKHALHHNIRLVQRLAGDARVIGVVKGNGYGLGLGELASHLVEYGVRHLAVSWAFQRRLCCSPPSVTAGSWRRPSGPE